MNYGRAKKEVLRLFRGHAAIFRNKRAPTGEQYAVVSGRDILGVGSSYEEALLKAMETATKAVDAERARLAALAASEPLMKNESDSQAGNP